jgi:hypothetical protein
MTAAARPSEVPPRTVHVVAAVATARAAGLHWVPRSSAVPTVAAAPTRTSACAAPAAQECRQVRRSSARAAVPNPATG